MLALKHKVNDPYNIIVTCPNRCCKIDFPHRTTPYCPKCYEKIIHPGDTIKELYNRMYYYKRGGYNSCLY